MSGGITSGLVDRSWPNLTNVGPSSSSISRSRRPRSASWRVVVAPPAVDQVPEAVTGRDASDLREPADSPLGARGRHQCLAGAPWSARPAGGFSSRRTRCSSCATRSARSSTSSRRTSPRRFRAISEASDGIAPIRSASARQLATASRTAARISSRSIPTRRARSSIDVVGRLCGHRHPAEPREQHLLE